MERVRYTQNIQRICIITLIFIGLTIFISITGIAETITVNVNGGADYRSIQEAINHANSSDSIIVESGTYQENILINKTLNIIGSGKSNTFLVGIESSKNTVKITADNINLSGFSIDNTEGTPNQYHCVFIDSSDYCTLSQNNIKNGENGIYIISSYFTTIEENTIQNNNQKGIRCSSSDNNVIYNNIIQSNGDGIYITNSDNNQIYENEIINNGVGVTLTVGSTTNIVYKNDFDDNTGGNAVDTSVNEWSKNNQGNYWDDYQGYDSNEDGIGDAPYIIDQDSQDDYPLGDFQTENQQPTAHIDSISPNPAITGETVSFHGHGSDDGTIIEWEWKSSKNGVFGSSADCTYNDLSIGTHTISFRVKDDQSQWSSYTTSILTIQTDTSSVSNKPPTAFISLIEPTGATVGEEIIFHGYGNDLDGDIVGYQWRSSIDGILSQQSSFSTTTLSTGSHTIYFKVRDNKNSWSSETSETVLIQEDATGNMKPIARLQDSYQGGVNDSILFDASKSYDPDGEIQSYQWDFGDNKTGSGKLISHTYKKLGDYTVTLTVHDSKGSIDIKTAPVSITTSSSTDTSSTDTNESTKKDGGVSLPSFEVTMVILSCFFSLYILKKKK